MPLPDESLSSEPSGQEESAESVASETAPDAEDARSASPAAAEGSQAGPPAELVVIGIGASAGGIDALTELLQEMPTALGAAIVIVQHLDPTHASSLDSILDQRTTLPVEEARDGTIVEPDHVYVIPPNRDLEIKRGRLRLRPQDAQQGTRRAIDHFFQSLAQDRGPHAIGIILSGTGNDGTAGLRAIHAQGGLSFVQDPDEAEQQGMPRHAIQEARPDAVLPAAEISEMVERYVRNVSSHPPREAQAMGLRQTDRLQPIVELLSERTGYDFNLYRQTTLRRQIERRMGLCHDHDVDAYAVLLSEDPEELETLYNDLLIGVTRFFRDPDAWEVLNQQVLKPLVAATENDPAIRVWCPGCASGEEAYSVAMLLHEQLADQAKGCRLQVFATDISEEAIATARRALYPETIRQDLSPERLRRFFSPQEDGRFRVAKNLRETVVFAEQNILSHPPFANLDLICCRNLAIYLEEEAQRRIDAIFDFALKTGGYLFLGNVEKLKTRQEAFAVVSEPSRIFRHVGSTSPARRSFSTSSSPEEITSSPHPPQGVEEHSTGLEGRVARQLVRESEMGVAVVDGENRVLYLQGRVDRYLQLPLGEAGSNRPGILDLARMGVRSRLHTLLARVRQNRQTSATTCHIHARDTAERRCRLTVRPLESAAQDRLLVTFEPLAPRDATETHDATGFETPATFRRAASEPPAIPADEVTSSDEASQEDEASQDEWVRLEDYRALQQKLATTQEQLSSSIEDLATANEELRATNEETISVNEELQSSNEELQTNKEELQSLNEELTTLNNQLEIKLQELQLTKDDLDNLLNSSHVATLFLDLDLQIRLFTPSCRSLFHLIASDIGRPLEDITRRFRDDSLLKDAANVIGDLQPRQTRVKTRT
jgi:two-component system CheB/CheR fusion protein